MNIAGLILIILGGVLLSVSMLALSFIRKEARRIPGWDCFDVYILGGLIGFFVGIINFFRDVSWAIQAGLRDRSSSAFHLLVLCAVSLGILVVGCVFWFYDRE